jgi:serine/threonine protein phosphatase PrpC
MAAVNVGDSRVYVLRKDKKIEHITTDHGPFEAEWNLYQNLVGIRVGEVNEQEQKNIQEKIANMDNSEYKKYSEEQFESIIRTKMSEFEEIKSKSINTHSDTLKLKNLKKEIVEDMKVKFCINRKNLISQSLGSDDVKPNIVTFDVKTGDRIIIASDGVHDNLADQEIIRCVSESKTAEKAALDLVKMARERSLDKTCPRSKPDDTTAVIMEIR